MIGSPQDLEYFMTVSETLNLTRAAERLGVSQPTLSLAVRRLETSLAVQLLVRGKAGVRLTRPGLKVASEARHLIASWIKVRDAAAQVETEVGGRFTLGCHPSVAIDMLPSFYGEIHRRHRGLEVQLVHGLSREVTEEVVSRRIDFAIAVNPLRHPDLVIHNLLEERVSLWQSRKYLQTALLICDRSLLQTQVLLRDLEKNKIIFTRVVHCPDLEVIASLTASGAGVGILPESVARRSRPSKLLPFDPRITPHRDQVCLVYRADLERSAASKAIIAAIRAPWFGSRARG